MGNGQREIAIIHFPFPRLQRKSEEMHLPCHLRMRGGFLLLEALIATAVFAVMIGAVSFALFFGQEGALKSGDRVRGVTLSEEAIGATQGIRDRDFDLLLPGVHGTCIGADGKWEFCGIEHVTMDGYTTRLTIESIADDHVRATASTEWDFGVSRTGSVLLTEEFTDWRAVKPIGDWTTVTLRGSYVDTDQPLFNAIALSGDFAFVSSDDGAGLYVFDFSDPAYPARVAAGFSLGATGYGLLVDGDTLYVSTGADGEEIQIFDVASPTSLSQDKKLGSIDIPGSGRARSLALFATTLLVGCTESSTAEELYSYDVSNPLSPDLLDSLDDTGSMYGLGLRDGYAYIASSMDAGELRVADVFDPSTLALATGGGYNLTDVHDGLVVVAVGEKIILGRRSGEVIEELILLDLSKGPVPAPPPGPWYQEVGGNVAGLAAEPGGRYAFIATDNSGGEFQVIDLSRFALGQTPVVETADPDLGGGRAVAYDAQKDRVVLATDRALLLYVPGS